MGHLTPTYVCQDTVWCRGRAGNEIWRLFWSGVDYEGGGGVTHLMEGSTTAALTYNKLKGLKLADNLDWRIDKKDSGEASVPTIPEHQDIVAMHANDIPKYDTTRALRELPMTAEDTTRRLPLFMDILIYRFPNFNDVPSHSAANSTWKASDLSITDSNKASVLYANHCNGSASKKRDWGINIFYTNGMVEWKPWDELRFQVMEKNVARDDNATHCYFF